MERKKGTFLERFIVSFAVGVCILMFTGTAIDKLFHLRSFYINILSTHLFNEFTMLVAVAIPIVELALVIWTVFSRKIFQPLLGAVLLILSFTLYVSYLMLFQKDKSCSCSGLISALPWVGHLLLNIFLTMFFFAAYLIAKYKLE